MAGPKCAPDDLSSFAALHYRRLVGALVLHCGTEELAEELAQDTLVRVCEHWDAVRSMADPAAWMFRTAFNLSSSWFRRKQAGGRAAWRRGPDPTIHHEPDIADALSVRAAVGRLPSRQRSVVILRYFLTYTPEETATVLGVTNGAVRSATHRALATLRKELAGTPTVVAAERGGIDAA